MKSEEIYLDDWQQEIVNHDGNICVCTGRQVGKTVTMSVKCAKYMIKNPNSRIIIVSLTEDQAKLIIVMILDYLEKNYNKQVATGKNKPTQSKVALKNGSVAIARPVGNTGDAVRGFTGDVLIIDEASRMPELAFTAAKPTLLTTAGQIWMCSTPFGKQGYFYESFLNKHKRFRTFHINSEEVIANRPIKGKWTERKRAEGIRFLEEERKDMSELQYGQEYLGLFLDELRQFFSDELIDRAAILKRPDIKVFDSRKEGYYVMGVDIARMGGDQCAYEILKELKEDRWIQVENLTKTKQFTTQTEEDILGLNRIWNLKKIGIDAGSGSLGVGIFDRLMKNNETKRKTIAMNNRSISLDRDKTQKQRIFKEDMYDNMLGMMERREIQLLDDDDVRLSLKSVQWELMKTIKGNKIRIFGNFTHIAEGLVRAAWIAKKEKSKKFFIDYI